MTTPRDPQHRTHTNPNPHHISHRQPDDDDGMMEIRLPIASTGDVRNDGDEPLTRDELRGMADQVDSLTTGVFPEHGKSDVIDYAGYSQFEKLGYWSDASIEDSEEDESALLMATARMPDPETLPAATGDYREALAILKEQAIRGIPITSSIGWREDDDSPGGNDLMEVSIVGVAADPRAGSEGGEQLVARAAVEAGVDPDELVAAVRDAVEATDDMTDDDTPDEGTTTEEEQNTTDDGEEQAVEKALDTLTEREVSLASLIPVVAEATGAEESAVEDALDGLQEDDDDDDEEEEEQADDEDEDEEEEDDEDEQSAEPDEEQSVDSDLAERLDKLEDDISAIRDGDIDLDLPDPEPEPDEEQDATNEEDDADDEEQRDTSDPADKPAWAEANQ